jgi:hypothetical protein
MPYDLSVTFTVNKQARQQPSSTVVGGGGKKKVTLLKGERKK